MDKLFTPEDFPTMSKTWAGICADRANMIHDERCEWAEYRRALEFIARMAVMGPYNQMRFEAMGQIALDALHGLPPEGSPYEA